MKMKHCPKCGNDKPLSEFHRNASKPDGKQTRCKVCQREAVAVSAKRHAAGIRARTRKWRQENPDAAKAAQKRYRDKTQNTPEGKIRRKLQRYGITLEAYEALVQRTKGRCHVCKKKRSPLHIDHCHATGKVRGMLCIGCNVVLGHVGEDVEVLRALIAYLS